MRQFLILAVMLCAFTAPILAQSDIDNTPYKIVFQLTTADTAAHSSTIRNINHTLAGAPKSTIEVVCHGKGLTLLEKSKTLKSKEVAELSARGVTFVACENTMRQLKVKKEDLLPQAGTVPSGVIEVVKKQRKKWAYIKAG